MILFYTCLCVLLVSGAKTGEEDAVVSAEELEDTAGRVQRVLNAFHEVSGVLSEVPRQLWMLPLRFGLLPGLKVFYKVLIRTWCAGINRSVNFELVYNKPCV